MKLARVSAEFGRYLLAGGLAFSIDVGVFQLALRVFGVEPLLATILGYGAGLIVVYVVSVNWVFSYRRIDRHSREFLLFTLIGLIGLIINMLVIEILAVRYGYEPLLAKVAGTAMTFGFNFIIRRWALFTERRARPAAG
jgi:putative flippase GtrA